MRITERWIQMSLRASFRAGLERLDAAQRRAISGRRIETTSDDPVDAAALMRLRARLGDVEQYRRSATSARTRLAAEEAVFQSARDVLARARSLAMSVEATDPADPARAGALQEIVHLQEQLVSLANTSVGGERLFGGGETAPPFLADGNYVGGSLVHEVEIDDGVLLPTSHTGVVFQGAFQALAQLRAALESGTPAEIEATVAPLADAERELLAREAEGGAWQRRIEDAVAGHGRNANLLLGLAQEIGDADPAEALLEVRAAQQALERAYAVAQRVLSTSLVEYLR